MKVYKKKNIKIKALIDFNINIPKGSIHGLLGPNGAGKSTFINILGGLVKKDKGKVNICGIDIDKYGLIFAGAQKNLGIAGLTIVIAKKDLIEKQGTQLPPIMRYEDHSNDNSMLNTSPVFAWYVAGLIFEWIEELKNVDVKDVEPLSNVAEISLRERDDTIVSDNSIEETLSWYSPRGL